MAKAKKEPKPRADKYQERLVVKEGSFMDMIKASVRDADKKAAKRQEA